MMETSHAAHFPHLSRALNGLDSRNSADGKDDLILTLLELALLFAPMREHEPTEIHRQDQANIVHIHPSLSQTSKSSIQGQASCSLHRRSPRTFDANSSSHLPTPRRRYPHLGCDQLMPPPDKTERLIHAPHLEWHHPEQGRAKLHRHPGLDHGRRQRMPLPIVGIVR